MTTGNARDINLNISSTFDVDKALENFGGEMSLFISSLSKLEDMTLEKNLGEIATAYDNKDYKKIKDVAHQLKGAVGYVGASRLYYQLYFIQFHFLSEDYQLQMAYYPGLIEAALQYKVDSRILLAEKTNKKYVKKESHDICPISE